jgi:chromosome partitioning protein
MAEIIAILNQKGGCGKTTTVINLGAALAQLGKQVLLIDLDPQGNATTGLGIEKIEVERTIYSVLSNEITMEEAVISTDITGLDLVPSNISLSGAEIELSNAVARESLLKNAFEGIYDDYDYIFIDVPPSLGLLTLNSLVASESVIIPIQAEFYALEGMADLLEAMELVESRLRSPSPIKGILLTLYDSRTRLGRDVFSSVKKFFGEDENVFQTTIPRNIKLAEAPSHGKPCIIYDEECNGSEAYKNLALEMLAMEENK